MTGSVTTWYFTPEIELEDQTEAQQARYDVTQPLFWKIKIDAVKSFISFVTFKGCFCNFCCNCFCNKCGKGEVVNAAVELTSTGENAVESDAADGAADGEREAEGGEDEDDAPIASSDHTSHSCLMYPVFWAIECAFPGIKKPDLPACVCCVAWFRAFRFHFGTLAVTSFIIAIVQLIQVSLNCLPLHFVRILLTI